MAAEEHPRTRARQYLLERWTTALRRLPAVEVIWLEGSLVDDRANPWSDIDLRVGIVDAAYPQLWETDRTPLLEGLGEHLLLHTMGFVRAVTEEGIIVELGVRRSSELASLDLYEWKVLFSRLPGGPPVFQKLPDRSTAETWPGKPVTVEDVSRRTKFLLLNLAVDPCDFHRGETLAASTTLDYLRFELFQVMYQRMGIQFMKRSKELSLIFPPDFMADLQRTYTADGEAALDPAAIAAAQLRTLAALGKHLQALSDQVGGGFEPEWFGRLFERLTEDMQPFLIRPLPRASPISRPAHPRGPSLRPPD